jgi:hypothetical protein
MSNKRKTTKRSDQRRIEQALIRQKPKPNKPREENPRQLSIPDYLLAPAGRGETITIIGAPRPPPKKP